MRIMTRSVVALVAGLSIASLFGSAGCASSTGDANEKLGGTDSAYGAWLPAPPWIPDIPMNGLPTRALVMNLLSTNYENSGELVRSPLTTATFTAGGAHPALAAAVAEPGTRDFLRYVVSCALTADQDVQVATPSGTVDMHGALGLCPSWGAANGAAGTSCQESVSACLLVFNNPTATTVPISFRGALAGHLLSLKPEVRPATITAAESGFDPAPTIAAFNTCGPYTYGVDAACGYNPRAGLTAFVGTCTEGAPVHVGTGSVCGSAELGYASGDTVLRVCEGLRGCDAWSGSSLGENDDSGGTLASCVSFTCPASGAFSVMVSAYDRSAPITATADAAGDPGNDSPTYPVSEYALFRKNEGTFFGNVFLRDHLAMSYSLDANGNFVGTPLLPPGQFPTPYQAMFACNDPGWTWGDAYMASRVCASGGSMPCAATPVGACPSSCNAGSVPAGYGAYASCSHAGTWNAPLTSFLHARTDVLGQNCASCGGQ